MKKRSVEKYCMDKKYWKYVKNMSKFKYYINDIFNERFFNDCLIKYNIDEVFRLKLKDYGKK